MPVVLTPEELDVLKWAVEGAEDAHAADPEDFAWPPDFEDLEYRIVEQWPDTMNDSPQEYGRRKQVAKRLLDKLKRSPEKSACAQLAALADRLPGRTDWWARTVLVHADADRANGQIWSCACGPCRAARMDLGATEDLLRRAVKELRAKG